MDKEVTLLEIRQYDTENYFKLENVGLREIKEQLRHTNRPMVDLPMYARENGEQINQVAHATMEQGDKVTSSITIDLDSNELTLYEINKIPEDARSNSNTSIKKYSITDFVKSNERENESIRPSLLENLHQKQEQLKNSQTSDHESRHKSHETVK